MYNNSTCIKYMHILAFRTSLRSQSSWIEPDKSLILDTELLVTSFSVALFGLRYIKFECMDVVIYFTHRARRSKIDLYALTHHYPVRDDINT